MLGGTLTPFYAFLNFCFLKKHFFHFFLSQGLTYPRVASNSLCSQGWTLTDFFSLSNTESMEGRRVPPLLFYLMLELRASGTLGKHCPLRPSPAGTISYKAWQEVKVFLGQGPLQLPFKGSVGVLICLLKGTVPGKVTRTCVRLREG